LNRYEPPVFQGHAIGCERCHGPGALHVNPAERSAESDLTIVNPADLPPTLRESVCQQCHLQGSYRFARAGRGPLDFRPGLPLHPFLAVFLMKKGDRGKFEAVGHVEQMESSGCFRASGGELGCTSCHDPHRLPPATRAEYYRGRCLECHGRRGCALPAAERRSRGPGEDCVACHMPRLAITNIPHTAATDHRIPRGTRGSVSEGPRVAPGQPADVPLMDYHWGLMTRAEQQDAERDRGVALSLASRTMSAAAPPLAKAAARQAVPLLEAAVRDRPDDLRARESLGYALSTLERREEALRAYQEVLRFDPDREMTLRATGRVLADLRQPAAARVALQRSIAVDPWRSDYHLALAEVCAQAGDWPGAVSACREAIRLNPERLESRSLLVQGYLHSAAPKEADAEFQILLKFYPASRELWQQWYEQQKRAGPGDVGPASNGHP
jgi:tetratricopeptide (TPR) repeat protein